MPSSLLQILPGPFNFLRPEEGELRRLLPEIASSLPLPKAVFLEDETATPLQGFPVLLSDGLAQLREALAQYVLHEERLQLAILRREPPEIRAYNLAWERYRELLARAVENATLSSYGRRFPEIFWLHHSLDLARLLKETPRRVVRADLELGRRSGDQIKYRVYERAMDRLLSAAYDVAQRLASATDEAEEVLFPRLLTRMRDNVLIFSEDHVGRDLAELGSYFHGMLRIDGRDFRERLERTVRWHVEQLETDRELREAVTHLLGVEPWHAREEALKRPGYLSYLATRRGYSPVKLLPPPLLSVWEGLLVKLQEFEALHAMRRLLLTVERRGALLICRDGSGGRGGLRGEIRLSPATRPLDFLEPWVLDPKVDRCGMIYDISEFSETVSYLHRSGAEIQDAGFRAMFRFQRRVNGLAAAHRIKLEKYLGDGAFYSGREARRMLRAAVELQRQYREALRDGFPFDRGLRLALNYGQYRLIPMGAGQEGVGEHYEFFGHGLIELSRLTSGKTMREIEEVKSLLVNQGYPEQTVNRFFEPLARRNLDVVDKQEEARPFYAYISRDGTLVNNGIVATARFLAQLDGEIPGAALQRTAWSGRTYVVLPLDGSLAVGVRKLGLARLKGLETVDVFEVVDGADLDPASFEEVTIDGLLAALERELAGRLGSGWDEPRGAAEGGR
ncbi:MAG TPA: hypothetical protein VF121_03940 [Thermoanaerobaculia bacterium]|nr:hypothetical protein [Thermoanaerobaculia bacterium]